MASSHQRGILTQNHGISQPVMPPLECRHTGNNFQATSSGSTPQRENMLPNSEMEFNLPLSLTLTSPLRDAIPLLQESTLRLRKLKHSRKPLSRPENLPNRLRERPRLQQRQQKELTWQPRKLKMPSKRK